MRSSINSQLLTGIVLLSCNIIAVLTAVVLSFRRLNGNLCGQIAERELAEEAFRESEERLRVIFEASQAGIIMVDPKGIICFANKRMAEMFGCSPEELHGSPYLSHLHPDDNRAGDTQMHRLISGTIDFVYTERRYLCNGGSFWGYLSGRRLLTADGELRALVGIITDITDRRNAEEARGKALKFIESLLAHSPMGISVFDGESGDRVRVNQAAADIAGGSIEELLQHNFRQLPSWCQSGLVEVAEAVLCDGATRPVETELHTLSGKRITVRYFLSRFLVEGKAHLLVIGQDVTEEKRREDENKRIEAQLLNMQKLESLGVLAGGIAHDFNNILTGIMGNITFAQMTVESSHKAHSPLEKAEKASRKAAELASQLLTFARGGQPIKKAFSVQHLVGESLSLVLRGTNVKGEVRIPHLVSIIEADEGQMNQAFNNIIINAVHAMSGGGKLTVSGENAVLEDGNWQGLDAGAYVKLSFTDEGCGISEADQKRVFDPYFSTKASGTGLGLASAHSIVKKHGGAIFLESAVGAGSCFTIYLPSTGKASLEGGCAKEPVAAARKGCSILVMDDEEMIRELAYSTLKELGYQVRTCVNGEEAVALYGAAKEAGVPFAAVIMDLTIPGAMGGKMAAQQIKDLDATARLIVSSGYSRDPVMAQYASFGFCATLVKPYSAREIARVLNNSLLPASA